MSTHTGTGLKHAATEPTQLAGINKRERRRGASGRAAALRRAPSDSDCSGETASLSADSGERARPPPSTTRSGKSRSRRRGSEWEVLEGLKDGQRFEKKPEVFNGYLHKKRKWPLKGWHKRFFVIDGGILVYARSPTDVARGRLHGSVDVGLSVISAKQRRRRIDIDADEFIYHLRAKTPDVFRTWLLVLKAHRLYRQHLLTFGTRESVPKILPPLEDVPPTDTSSRTSKVSCNSLSSVTSCEEYSKYSELPFDTDPSDNTMQANSDLENFAKQFLPLYSNIDVGSKLKDKERMFSISYEIGRCDITNAKAKEDENISNSTNFEKHVVSTDLDLKSATYTTLAEAFDTNETLIEETTDGQNSFDNNKSVPTTFFCFARKKKVIADNTVPATMMMKSRKCTNLVKYKNMGVEPALKESLNKCMLLKKHGLKLSKDTSIDFTAVARDKCTDCNIIKNKTEREKVNKTLQEVVTGSNYDKLIENLMVSVLGFPTMKSKREEHVKTYLKQVLKELYEVPQPDDNEHPVKQLFKCLLEYWLKNTSIDHLKDAIKNAKSNKCVMKDAMLSAIRVKSVSKETQFHGISYYTDESNAGRLKIEDDTSVQRRIRLCRQTTESFEKEKRIQELEKMLKNTIYICGTELNNQSKEKDIQITKTLIENLEKLSRKSGSSTSMEDTNINETPNSSAESEIPKIKETMKHLISEAALPPGVAKEFLHAYLDILLNESGRSATETTTSQSSDQTYATQKIDNQNPKCDVQTDSVQKMVSKSVTTIHTQKSESSSKNCDTSNKPSVDSGQLYLKDFLNTITTIFAKGSKFTSNSSQKDDSQLSLNFMQESHVEDACKILEKSRTDKTNPWDIMVQKNNRNNCMIIDLSKYDLEDVSFNSDVDMKGNISIMIKLKQNPNKGFINRPPRINFKFSNENNSKHWLDEVSVKTSNSSPMFRKGSVGNYIPKSNLDFDKQISEIKPYISNSDATSKKFEEFNDSSDRSVYLPAQSTVIVDSKTMDSKINETKQPHSCYIMSTFKKAFQSKKKVRLRQSIPICVNTRENTPSEIKYQNEPHGAIDEKFILILLENLNMLSKNTPCFHKDINNVYTKLRKKYDRMYKVPNVKGLGLLGMIYKKEPTIFDKADDETQYEVDNSENLDDKTTRTDAIADFTEITDSFKKAKLVNQCVSIHYIYSDKCTATIESIDAANQSKHTLDEAISTLIQSRNIVSTNRSTETLSSTKPCFANSSSFSSATFQSISFGTYKKSSKSVITPNWYASPTIVNQGFKKLKNTENRVPVKVKEKQKVTKYLKKEIPLLTSKKVSRLSQTDGMVVKDKQDKDFKIYQLFMRRTIAPKLSRSETGSDVKPQISDDLRTIYRCHSEVSYCSGLLSPASPPLRGPQAGFVSGTPGGRLASWIVESGGPLENVSRELGQAQLSVQQLQRLLDAIELHHQVHHDTDVSLEGASPNVKKDRRKFGLRKKKSNSKCASVELAPFDGSTSHMALSALTAPPSPGGGACSAPNSAASLPIACAATRPQSLPGAEALPAPPSTLTPELQLREDFSILAKDLLETFKSVVTTLVCERSRLRQAMETSDTPAAGGAVVAALRTNLTTALQQNSELRTRLSRIHDASDLAEISSMGPNSDPPARPFAQSLSYSSSCVSASEFFDAEEHEEATNDGDHFNQQEIIAADEAGVIELDGDSSSEVGSLSSEEGSASSDNSDGALLSAEPVTLVEKGPLGAWTRRTALPAPRPSPAGPSLWNLLYKNIGKDLSQISMPVTINEPLNMLQRLCEELEYSELLDSAAICSSPIERMSLVAAFAVSAYSASSHRAASKPFNPLLGETYECTREDRRFSFLSEQVSHHPPISACHADSPRWTMWQEARIRTKFWGKSMEFQPAGRVHVRLKETNDHYSWNKVTTCVHNLFGGQRWVDQYGDMHIKCHGTDITCKLNFIKASSWSSTKHEVRGSVMIGGTPRLRLTGRWSEALYAGEPPANRTLWRPGAMPPDHEVYYGFTRFAMELNEMEPGMSDALPHTDTRFRPDQRALEEGDVDSAERYKHQLEQAQRERRRDSPEHTPCWFRKGIEEGEEMWVYNGEYWKAREAGFPNHHAPRLW